jgi:hypothetical protein
MAIMDRIDIRPAVGFPKRFFGKIIKEYDNGSIEMKVKYPEDFEGDMIFPEEGIKIVIRGVYVPAHQAVKKSEPEFEGDEDKEAYLDYIHNAGPRYADRKKKSGKPKPKRKVIKKCKCK